MYFFSSNQNIKFSNGRELAQNDIEYTFSQFQDSSSPYSSTFKEVESISVDGTNASGFKVVVKLKKFKASFLSNDLPILKILPRKEIEELGGRYLERPMGSGPYSFEETSEQQLLLSRNSYFPDTHKHVEKIIFKIIKDDFTRYQKLKKGQLDIVQADIPSAKVAEFEKDSDQFVVHKYPGLSMTYLLINLKDPNLNHLGLRRSLAQAINRKEIIKYKLEGLAKEATSILTPNNPFHAAGLTNIPFDFHQAVENIENMGFKDLKLTLKTSNNHAAVENARVIVNQLNKSGLDVKLESYEWGTFYNDVKSANFQLATMRWVGVLDPDIYRLAFHSSETPPKGRNRGAYVNKKLDALLEEGLYIKDFEKRKGLYADVQRTVMKDLPIIPLWYDEQVAIVNKRVKNYVISQNGDFTPFLTVYK
ncbi:MAG: ABC transporter substrate-binding protein [Bdellovibrionales bacterium]